MKPKKSNAILMIDWKLLSDWVCEVCKLFAQLRERKAISTHMFAIKNFYKDIFKLMERLQE